jgi:hypothetical protein
MRVQPYYWLCGVIVLFHSLVSTLALPSNSSFFPQRNGFLSKQVPFMDYLSGRQESDRSLARLEKMNQRATKVIEISRSLFNYTAESWSPPHNSNGNAIFTTALHPSYGCVGARRFAGTARLAGFKGDILISILPTASSRFISCLKELDVIAFVVHLDCDPGAGAFHLCRLKELPLLSLPVVMLRYYIYQYWATLYEKSSLILLADFRDTFFQSDPFVYRAPSWHPPVAQITLFQHNFPLRVLYRDQLHANYVRNCYGQAGLNRIGSNTVASGSTVIGSRDGMLVYVSERSSNRFLYCKLIFYATLYSLNHFLMSCCCSFLLAILEIDWCLDSASGPQDSTSITAIGHKPFPLLRNSWRSLPL